MNRYLKKYNRIEHTGFTEHVALSREEVIDQIIDKDLLYYGSMEWLVKVLKNGFAGYKTLSNHDLIEAFNNHYPDHCLTIVEPVEGGN